MKKVLFSIATVLAMISLAACGGEKKENTETGDAQEAALRAENDTELDVDLVASHIVWEGTKIGGAHHGTIALQSAQLSGNPETKTIGSGSFVIDMNSIECQDLTDAATNKMLVDHLKSADFFDVEKYPISTFEIVSAERIADSNRYTITGNLTMKETTNSIKFEAQVTENEGAYTAVSDTIRLDRTLWGVNYGSKNIFKDLKDNIIDDQMSLVVTIVAY